MGMNMKLVVGLGNPGPEYQKTRHNIGFDVVTRLAARNGGASVQVKYEASMAEINIGGEKVILCCPLTYMNLSGRAVMSVAGFYKIEAPDILVICDDMNIPFGALRFRSQGSAGGQKGLAHIIQLLKTEVVSRLRMGIGRPPANFPAADYVLSRFKSHEQKELDLILDQASDGVECWVKEGITPAMNKFNSTPPGTSGSDKS
jgi:PTH1 family peptidyl-tRNA hydrolase